MYNIGQKPFGIVGVSGPAALIILGPHNAITAIVGKLNEAAFGASNLPQVPFRITSEFDFVSRGINHLGRGALSEIPRAVRLWKTNYRTVLQLCKPTVACPLLSGFVKTSAGF